MNPCVDIVPHTAIDDILRDISEMEVPKHQNKMTDIMSLLSHLQGNGNPQTSKCLNTLNNGNQLLAVDLHYLYSDCGLRIVTENPIQRHPLTEVNTVKDIVNNPSAASSLDPNDEAAVEAEVIPEIEDAVGNDDNENEDDNNDDDGVSRRLVANSRRMEKLLSMGFSYECAESALLATKNADLQTVITYIMDNPQLLSLSSAGKNEIDDADQSGDKNVNDVKMVKANKAKKKQSLERKDWQWEDLSLFPKYSNKSNEKESSNITRSLDKIALLNRTTSSMRENAMSATSSVIIPGVFQMNFRPYSLQSHVINISDELIRATEKSMDESRHEGNRKPIGRPKSSKAAKSSGDGDGKRLSLLSS
jgi:hypothetical protein